MLRMRPPSRQAPPTRTFRTYCRVCEAVCGLIAEVQGDHVTRLRPDRGHPVSRGFCCKKGTTFHRVGAHPTRITQPLRRVAGRLQPTTWEAAYAAIGRRLHRLRAQYGPHAIGLYWGNPLAFNTLGLLSSIPFTRALGTRNVFSAGSQDCNNKFRAAQIVHGSPFIHPVPDLAHADLALLLGTNPAVSQGSFVHLPGGVRALDDAVARGAELIWVDPRRTESARRFGQHLAIRPGTDLWLLLALLAQVSPALHEPHPPAGLDRLLQLARTVSPARAAATTGIAPQTLITLAKRIQDAPRATFHLSVGVNMGPFGTLCAVTLQALAYVTGNLDRQGGLLFHPLGPALDRLLRPLGVGFQTHTSRVGGHPATFDTLPGGILADEIRRPGKDQLRALIVVAGDPLRSIPGADALEHALGTLDTLVCVDPFQSATARHAEWILPTPTWLERWDLALPGLAMQAGGHIPITPAVIPAPPGVRPESQIFAALASAAGVPFWGSPALTHILAHWPINAALTRLGRALGHLCPSLQTGLSGPAPRPGAYLRGGPRHPDRRLRFWGPSLDAEPARMRRLEGSLAEPDGWRLITRRRRLGHNSWLHGGARDGQQEAFAHMHPDAMATLGVQPNDLINIQGNGATLCLPVRPDRHLALGTLVVPHGLPNHNINRLIPAGSDRVEPPSGQLWMTGVPISVTRRDAPPHAADEDPDPQP